MPAAASPHRRHILAGLSLGAAGLVTADRLDTSAKELDTSQGALATLADRWETLSLDAISARLHALQTRHTVVAKATPAWAEVDIRTLTMLAQAQADTGDIEAAAQTAARATRVAKAAGLGSLAAGAETVAGEIYAKLAPNGDEPIAMLTDAARRGTGTSVAVQATILRAYALSGRPGTAGTVLELLAAAEAAQAKLPPSAGWPRWTPANLHAYGGLAAVRVGRVDVADEWLATAQKEAANSSGLGAAVEIYRAHAAAAAGKWDGVVAAARQALTLSAPRGMPSWLSGGLQALYRAAPSGGPRRELLALAV